MIVHFQTHCTLLIFLTVFVSFLSFCVGNVHNVRNGELRAPRSHTCFQKNLKRQKEIRSMTYVVPDVEWWDSEAVGWAGSVPEYPAHGLFEQVRRTFLPRPIHLVINVYQLG